MNGPPNEQEESQGRPKFKKRSRERVPVGKGASECNLHRAYECEEQDESKYRYREGVQVKRIGEVATKSGAGRASAATEEARQASESFETAGQCGERWIQAFENGEGDEQN
jgi:hypothetical protein